MTDSYSTIKKCIDGCLIASVEISIKIGKTLTIAKSEIKHGEWTSFIEENFSISIRSCQDFMYLAKQSIAKKYYKLGTAQLILRLRSGEDLSV